jgi:putative endonuclease
MKARSHDGSSGTPKPGATRTDDRRALGAEGEARAARFLARRGYRIVARNVRAGGVEVDLVVRRASLVAFVEVKTRRTSSQGAPELAVDARKQARLVRAAAAWLHENPGVARRVRFDVVTCRVAARRDRADRDWHIEHWPGAFDAGG